MIRLAVWGRAVFRGNDPYNIWEPFDCRKTGCFVHDERDDKQRAALSCNRIDLPPVKWDVSANALARRPNYHIGDRNEHGNPKAESWDHGCPASFYHTPFIWSIIPYLRERTEHGARNANPFFDRCDDWLVIDAVLYWETEQSLWHSRQSELIRKEMERKK